jgi:putative endonuclease
VLTGHAKLALGASAEERAARVLEDAGYTIVERNYRCEVGELDLVARLGDLLVFVEVRARSSRDHGAGAEQIIGSKRAKVSRVAAAYLALVEPSFERARFDVIALTEDTIDWIPDAWRLGDRRAS